MHDCLEKRAVGSVERQSLIINLYRNSNVLSLFPIKYWVGPVIPHKG